MQLSESSQAVLDTPSDDVSDLTLVPKVKFNERKELMQWDDLEEAIQATGITTIRVTTQMQLKEVLGLDSELKKHLTVRTNDASIKQALRNAVSKGDVERAQQVIGRKESVQLVQADQAWQKRQGRPRTAEQEAQEFAQWISDASFRLKKGEHVDVKIESLTGVQANIGQFVRLLQNYPAGKSTLHVRATNDIAPALNALLKKNHADIIKEDKEREARIAQLVEMGPIMVEPTFFSRLKSMWPWGKKKAS